MYMFKDNLDMHDLGEKLSQQIANLRIARYYATAEQMREIDNAIDDFTCARKMVAKLTGGASSTPDSAKQECLNLDKCFLSKVGIF